MNVFFMQPDIQQAGLRIDLKGVCHELNGKKDGRHPS
jgi:hypothetical protein